MTGTKRSTNGDKRRGTMNGTNGPSRKGTMLKIGVGQTRMDMLINLYIAMLSNLFFVVAILAYILDGRYLDRADSDFVQLCASEIGHFVEHASADRYNTHYIIIIG